MKRVHKLPHAAVNIVITILIVALYFALNGDVALPAMSANIIYRGESDSNIALQCAVGYDASSLTGILDTLRARQVNITFIVSGEWAGRNPDIIMRMKYEGHEIAAMGDSGQYAADAQSVEETLETIEMAAGEAPAFYYAGNRDEGEVSAACESLGVSCILCTVDLLCSRGDSSDILQRARENIAPGSIVTVTPTREFYDALVPILDLYLSAGLGVVPTGEIVFGAEV